jgi:hypothetical protein
MHNARPPISARAMARRRDRTPGSIAVNVGSAVGNTCDASRSPPPAAAMPIEQPAAETAIASPVNRSTSRARVAPKARRTPHSWRRAIVRV